MIEIKVYKKENIDDFTRDFLSEDSLLDSGSINAASAALAATLFKRAVDSLDDSERNSWLKKNSEILRTYFIHLIDDDIKARRGYLKEVKEGNPDNIEAAMHPACSINEEVINMLSQMMNLILETCGYVSNINLHYLKEAADLSIGIIRSSIDWLISFTSSSLDDTYRFVVKRENELILSECEQIWKKILEY